MPEPVAEQHIGRPRGLPDLKIIAAGGFVRVADAQPHRVNAAVGPGAFPAEGTYDRRSGVGRAEDIERIRQAHDRPEPEPCGIGGTFAVLEHPVDIRDPRPAIGEDHVDDIGAGLPHEFDQGATALRVTQDVRRGLRGHDREFADACLGKTDLDAMTSRKPPHDGHGAAIINFDPLVHSFTLMETVVPFPGAEWTSNPCERRLAPPRPLPSPPAVV